MKKILLAIFFSLFAVNSAFAQSDISADEARKGIIGQWQLLSFERKGVNKDDYANEKIIWKFDGKQLDVESKDLKGRHQGDYKLLRSYFRISRTIIIIADVLNATHLPHRKFVVKSIKGDILTLSDWDDETIYKLKKVKKK